MSTGFCIDCPRLGDGTASRSVCCMAENDAVVAVMERVPGLSRHVVRQMLSPGNRAQRRKQRAKNRKARK